MPKNPPNIFDWMPPGQRKKLLEQKPAMKPMEDAPEAPPAQSKKMLPGQAKVPKQKQDTEFEYDQYLGIFVGVGHGGHGPGGSHQHGSGVGGGGSGPLPPPGTVNYRMDAGTGVFSLGATEVGSRQNHTLAAGTGVFSLNGKDATMLYQQTSTHYVLGAGVGQFNLNGQSVGLTAVQSAGGTFALGVNLAGMDFAGQVSQTSTAPFYQINYSLAPTIADLDYWQARGCPRIRLPIRWEHIQPVLMGALEPTYLATCDTLINGAISRGMKVLFDIHSFGNYYGVSMGTGSVTIAAFNDLWGRLATHYLAIAGDQLAFDLMNEPVGLPEGETTWVAFAKGAISTVHAIDPNRPIYVEGYYYASSWSWLSNNPTLHTVRDAAPTHPITISAHCYADHNNEGNSFNWVTEVVTPGGAPPGTNTNLQILVQRTTDWRNWLVQHNYKGHIGEVGLPASWDNPRPVNDVNWQTTFQNLVNVCIPAGIEIDAWAAGPYWGNYPQSVAEYNGRQSRAVPTLQTYWGNNVQPTVYFADGPHRGLAGVDSDDFIVDYRGTLAGSVTVTPHSSAGGTWTPATRVLTGVNPVGTFKLNIATEQVSQITFTNNGGWTDPASRIYSTQVDDFATIESSLQNVFSFQRKVATYIGPCLRLRRSSDNAESDFNFTANTMYAFVDTAAIAAFKGASTNLYLVRWYNQSDITNTNGNMLPPYTDSSSGGTGGATLAEQPEYLQDWGDGYPAIVFDGAHRMDCESPLENVTGQVIIANLSGRNFGSDAISWSFIAFASAFMPGWEIATGNGTQNIYGTTSDNIYMTGPSEVGEFHSHAGSWTGGHIVNGVKVWRDNILMGVGDSGANYMCVDFHRNTCNIGYRRFGASRWYGQMRDVTLINGPVADGLVQTIAGRDITKYSTTASKTQIAPDIVLDFAANTYTVDGGASSLAANVGNSPTRDSQGLICDGTQTYIAQGPLLTALQGDDFTIQIDTDDLVDSTALGYETLFYLATAANAKFIQYGWQVTGGVWGTYAAVALAGLGSEQFFDAGVDGQYSDDHGTGYKSNERRHIITQDKGSYLGLAQEGENYEALSANMPNWLTANIGWWPQGTWAGVKLRGRIKRIKVWRRKLNRWQCLRACENLPAKGSVTSTFKMGVNLSGMEFSTGLPGDFEAYPTAQEALYYGTTCGMKIARIPFRWERMQPTLNGPLAAAELAHLKTIVANNSAKGLTSLLDLHNYASYYNVATATWLSIGDGSLTTAHGSDFWSKMAQQAEFNRSDVWFGLMNEPVGDSRAPTAWFTTCSAWASAIRAYNTTSFISVPGNNRYTAAIAWSTNHGAAYLSNYVDPSNKSVFEVHAYFDSDLSGTHPGQAVQGAARSEFMNCVRWARNNGVKFLVGECGWPADWSLAQACVEADEAMELLRNADDVCVAFCYWAGGPSWGSYFQNIEPVRPALGDGTDFTEPRGDRPQMSILRKWVPNPYIPPPAFVTYYVDTAGSDSNDGLTAATPWQTLAKVNAATLSGGSAVMFKGGQTFIGTLVIPSGGTPGNPVVYGSYGTGRATISPGNGAEAIRSTALNLSNFTIQDLICVGGGRTTSTKEGILLASWNLSNPQLAGVTIKNCDVSGFGKSGITIAGWDVNCGFTGLVIQDCICHDNAGAAGTGGTTGINFYGNDAGTYSHINPIVRRCQAYGNTGTNSGATNWTGSGIVLGECSGAITEYCVAHDNGVNSVTSSGPVGIFMYDCLNSTIQFCESYNNKTASHTDGGGFDLDGGCINCTIQYCYSHNNMGPGYLMYKYPGLGWDNNTIRYCISENDGSDYAANPLASGIGIQSNSGALTNVKVYQNTIYQNLAGGAACLALGGNQSSSGIIANNVFYTGTTGSNLINAPLSQSSMLFRGNNYYATTAFTIRWNGTPYGSLAAWRTASGEEIVGGVNIGLSVNPTLTSPGAGVTVNSTTAGALAAGVTGYTQLAGSPMRNSGRNLSSEFGLSTGSHDFYGHAAPYEGAYDVGAAEAG